MKAPMAVTGVRARTRPVPTGVLSDWLDAQADGVPAWVPGRVVICRVCQTR